MSVVIDTGVVEPSERFAFWSEALTRAAPPYPYRMQRQGAAPFWGRMTSYQLGSLEVARVSAAPFGIVRDAEPIRALDAGYFSIIVQLDGRYAVNQRGRTAILAAGDITSYESGAPYTIQALSPYDIAVYRIPVQLFGQRTEFIRARTALRIGGNSGIGTVAASFLRHLAQALERGEISQSDCALSTMVLDLVGALYRPASVPPQRATHDSSVALLAAIKQFIEANLHDRELSVERIAAIHFISPRLLYRLFQREGWGVAEWIRLQRLDRCCRDLCSQQYADEPVAAIAARWAFPSQAHFSRLFRATYGYSPREFRQSRSASTQVFDRTCTTA